MEMKMNNLEYYNIEFTPAIGSFYLNTLFSEFDDNYIPIYKAFLIFPLFSNYDFLEYILKRNRTFDFYKLIEDYTHEQKTNDFWLDYSIKYLSTRNCCFESIYFGLMINAFELTEMGIRNKRILSKEVPILLNNRYDAIKKIGKVTKDLNIGELFRILKVGEVSD